jgi:hypothetical protein
MMVGNTQYNRCKLEYCYGKAGNSYCADFGFNYMAGERVQLDIAANLDVCNPKQCWAVSLGVAWQINIPKTK